jgi:hypothetical protein
MATIRTEKRVRTIEHTVTTAEDTANAAVILLNPNKKGVDKSRFMGTVQARNSAGVQTVTALTVTYNNTLNDPGAGQLTVAGALAVGDVLTIHYSLYDIPQPITNNYPL